MHLTDCFTELLAYVAYFSKSVGEAQPPFEQVRGEVDRLLAQSSEPVRKGLVSAADHDQARFAVCAWVDETILGSAWKEKGRWQREQLQRVHYGTTEAGEEFFERLNAVGFQQREVREVYYLCLALGFAGRHCNPGDEFLLDQLKTSNLKLLLGTSVGVPSLERETLFPEAFPADGGGGLGERQGGFSLFTAAFLAGPPVLFLLLFLIYRFSLSGIGDNFLKTLGY